MDIINRLVEYALDMVSRGCVLDLDLCDFSIEFQQKIPFLQ